MNVNFQLKGSYHIVLVSSKTKGEENRAGIYLAAN